MLGRTLHLCCIALLMFAPTACAQSESDNHKIVQGSIDDINSIGHRNIGKRGLGNWYSADSEAKMGRLIATEIDKSSHFITDPVVTDYINRIGQNLVQNSDAKGPFTIKVIDSDEVNAMALPGGYLYVNKGLILQADNEAQLAAVMAHEIAHVAAHHATRQMTRAEYAQFGMVPLIFIGGWTGYGVYSAAQIGVPVSYLEFSRAFESEADLLGLEYMYRAGYDPRAMIAFFEDLEAQEKHHPGLLSKAFSDHPMTADRIERAHGEIVRLLPPRDHATLDTPEFDAVKSHLRGLYLQR